MVWREWISTLWNPWLLAFFFLVGGYYSLRTGFFQLFYPRHWMGRTLGPLFRRGKQQAAKGRLTQFQAMATALGATVGTSSIAGVATAIYFGGPGAVFWMWVSALLGMMTGYSEKVLAIRYRRRDKNGQWKGGPAEYMTRGLRCPPMAKMFCLACLLASFTGGNLVQANSLAWGMQAAFGAEVSLVGTIVAGLVAVVIFGGIGRIGKVSSGLVPVMALLFVGGGIWVLAVNHAVLPRVFREIVTSAFTVPGLTGGGAGYSVAAALRYGVARGVFTNEAGLGSSAMAHAVADVDSEHTQGLWGMLEVFLATLVIATVSALVILSAGIYQPGEALRVIDGGLVDSATVGAPLAVRSFETVMGGVAGPFLAICLALFAISSLLGWSYYGERALEELVGSQKGKGLYRVVFIALILVGSVSQVDVVWELADLCNGLMALPNLTALLFLSPEVLRIWRKAVEHEKTPG